MSFDGQHTSASRTARSRCARSRTAGPLACVLAAAAIPAAGLLTAGEAAAVAVGRAHHVQPLAVTRLSFAERSVNASGGGVRVALRWRITDTRKGASRINGSLTLAAPGARPGSYLTQKVSASFALKGASQAHRSGSARRSAYTYEFVVPRYALAGRVRWQVISLTVRDNKGDKLRLSASQLGRFKATLRATELADTTAPTLESLQLSGAANRNYVYSGPRGSGPATAAVCLHPAPDGFAGGSLQLTGPDSRTLTAPFTASALVIGRGGCAYDSAAGSYGQPYKVAIKFPASSSPGVWTATRLELADALGNTSTATQLGGAGALTVTGDNQYPLPTDCQPGGPTPVAGSGDVESVQFVMQSPTASCAPTGITIIDGDGNVAVYGSEYAAPATGLTVTQVPDTTPPVATAASLNVSSATQSQVDDPDGFVTLTIQVTTGVAPVNYFTLGLYQNGKLVQSELGGVSDDAGKLSILVATWDMNLAVGTYTVGFTVQDVGGLNNSYGPGGTNLMPGGPVTLTVTAG